MYNLLDPPAGGSNAKLEMTVASASAGEFSLELASFGTRQPLYVRLRHVTSASLVQVEKQRKGARERKKARTRERAK